MGNLGQDVRYALRQLRKNPGFAMVAVLTLAFGIGANTAIFTLLDQALLRSLPVKDPASLTLLKFSGSDSGHLSNYGGDEHFYFSYPMYKDLRDKNQVFSGVVATSQAQAGVVWHNHPELAQAEIVSGNYFDVLGVRPAFGRLFVQSDDQQENANPVVVLSFGYWQRHFGADPSVVNQTILIDGHPYLVTGVSAPTFHSVQMGFVPDIYVPMMMTGQVVHTRSDLADHRSRWLNIVGRLKPGLSVQAAQAGINPLWHALRAEELAKMGDKSQRFREGFLDKSTLSLLDGRKGFSPLRENIGLPLKVVMGMVVLVVLLACANVSSLLLVRAAGRVREMSVRYALGAERSRIVRQLLIEGVILGLMGGALGAVMAPEVATVLQRDMIDPTGNALPFSSHPDLRILAFTFGIAFVVSVLFSLAPIAQFWKPNLIPALKLQNQTASGGAQRLRSMFVAAQIVLSLLLLFGAGLFARTLFNLKTVDVGFATSHLMQLTVDPTNSGYSLKDAPAVYRNVLSALAAVPGVRSAAATTDPELSNTGVGYNITIAGYKEKEDENMDVEGESVSAGYFSTLQIPLVAGRTLPENEDAGGQQVALVNERFAKRFFGSAAAAVGHAYRVGGGEHNTTPWVTVLGVVRDVKHSSVRDETRPTVFRPYLQDDTFPHMTFYLQTQQSPEAASATIRRVLQQLDPKLVPDGLKTVRTQIEEDLGSEHVVALLAMSFGLLATLLAALGLYSVLAYSTAQRTQEIGIRMALGSSRAAVVKLVLTQVAWLLGASLVVAVPLAMGLSRLIESRLFGITGHDPGMLALVTLLTILVAAAAAAFPARRAASVNPTTALRYE
jgi:putative ABC transport system permease protein